jgi:hypothetical protein
MVQIDKRAVSGPPPEKGQQDQASQAEQHFPDQADTDKNADLRRLGIDPQAILEKFMGRGGIPSL